MADETVTPGDCAVCPIPNAASFYTAMQMKTAVETDALRSSNAVANAQANNILQTQGLALAQKHAFEIGLDEARAGAHTASADVTSNRVASSALAIAAAQIMAKAAQTTPVTTAGAPAAGT